MLEGCKVNKCLEKRKRKAGWDGVVKSVGERKGGGCIWQYEVV